MKTGAKWWLELLLVAGMAGLARGEARYMVVDMAGGAAAATWGVEYWEEAPAGGFNTEEYKTTKMVLRRMEAGTFLMGSPEGELGRSTNESLHQVTLTEDYWIGLFEVTQKQWELATGIVSSKWSGATRPVDSASHADIRGTGVGAQWPADNSVAEGSFLWVLRKKTGLTFDLPTEAQWEMACRAGTETALNSGKNLTAGTECPNMAEVGRYLHNQGDGKGGYGEGTATVGSYAPNAWGLFDMHGNAEEWCLDWYTNDLGTAAAVNPPGPQKLSGSSHLVKGGDCECEAKACRSAWRTNRSYGATNAGCRVACSISSGLKFESLGTKRSVAERPALCATTGTEGWGGALSYGVVSGPGVVEDGTLRFTGVGAVTVRATLAATGEHAEQSAEQTVTAEKASVKVALSDKIHDWDGTAKAVTVAMEPPGVEVRVTYGGEEACPTEPGAYPVVAEVTQEHCEGRVEGSLVIVAPGEYLVVDLSGGPAAETFPVWTTRVVPSGGWTNAAYKDKLVLRRVKTGTYVMGSPEDELGREAGEWPYDYVGLCFLRNGTENQRMVVLSNDFWVGVSEMTSRQSSLVNGSNSYQSYAQIRGKDSGNQWPNGNGVDEGSFLRALREKTGLTFDLPTEEQWEFACRAGTTTALPNGWNLTDTTSCPHLEEIRGDGFPNAWGLYGMLGNGWEWCLNRSGTEAAVRGGSWEWNAAASRSAARGWVAHTNSYAAYHAVGPWPDANNYDYCHFRVACTTSNDVSFERIGTREWTERVKLTATTGSDDLGKNFQFTVESGVGVVENGGWLSFTGPGTTVVRASLAVGGSVAQTVTVTRATAEVRVDSRMVVEGAGETKIGVETTPPGLEVSVTYNGEKTVPTAAGAYAVKATVDNGRYAGSGEGTLVIVPAGEYLEVDLSGGPEAHRFGTRVLSGPPAGGWGDEYKTTKLLLRLMEAGTYQMGAPYGELGRGTNEPLRTVTLPEPHWMGVFEVTQKQWELVTGSNPSGLKGEMRPVESVDLAMLRGTGDEGQSALAEREATSFAGILREKTGLTFDLPTEEQWEYACRAGTGTALNNGWNLSGTNTCLRLAEVGRYYGNSGWRENASGWWGWNGTSDGRGGVTNGHTVAGSYLPNVWGMYDMHGNVREICRNGVARGGSWSDFSSQCRSASRCVQDTDPYLFNTASPQNRGVRLECASGREVVFEPIGDREWNESVPLRASTGGVAGMPGELEFAVTSGPGAVENGVLTFSGPGEVVVRATLPAWGEHGAVSVAQTVTVKRVQATLTLNGKVQAFDGTAKAVEVETVPPGLSVEVTYNGSTNPPTAAGTYRVHATAAGERYEGTGEGTMVIVAPGRYRVVDLSGGPNADRYPVSELDAAPEGGWGEEYKTEKLVLRWVEAGTFTMGASSNEVGRPERRSWWEDTGFSGTDWTCAMQEPRHQVTLTEGYWIGVFENTQKQWELVTGGNPSACSGASHPVEGVSYDMIRGGTIGAGWPATNALDPGSFMDLLQKKTGLAFDLPTEAQWEMACRAGTTNALNSGWELSDTNECAVVAEIGRYAGNLGDDAGGDMHAEVGQYLPNVWGLYDMSGNVAEWCLDWDWYDQASFAHWDWDELEKMEAANLLSQTNPPGAFDGNHRVVKGGSWKAGAWQCRSAYRDSLSPNNSNYWRPGTNAWTGFRVACRAGELPENPYTEESPVAVEKAWLGRYAAALASAGGNYEAAAVADWDGDGAAAWEEYVAGTNPEDKGDVFKVTGWTWKGGEMVPEYGPKDEGTRTYTVEATDEAGGAYTPIPEMGAAEGRRFYRVRVEMK